MAESPGQKPLGQKLVSTSGYLFVTSIAGGLLGYAYSVAMGRMLGPEDYGLLGALLALVPILSVPISTMNIAMARLFSRHLALHGSKDIRQIFWRNQFWLLGAGVCGLVVFAALSVMLRNALRSPDILPIAFIGLNIFFMLLLPIANALAQSRHHFGFLAVLNVLGPLAKLVGSAALVAIGWGVQGAALGLALASGFLAIFSIAYCWRKLDAPLSLDNPVDHVGLRDLFPVLLATLAFNFLFQVDVLLAKAFFDAEHAGYYAAAATLGKAVMYLPSAVVVPLLPMAAAGSALKSNTGHLLAKAIALTLVMTVLGAGFYWFFAEQVTLLLFGEAYRDAGHILKWYGWAMVPVALIMVLEHYLLAQGKLLFAYLVFLGAPLLALGAWYFRGSPMNLVWVMLSAGVGILAVALIFWLVRMRGTAYRTLISIFRG
ncbi:oligosaccharide flippase family protein [Acidovorax sp. GBBC 3334]|uniref:oligosaccharide flippase family protein n=1 Tax=Acidovorax sp. GBBC 3334 TaxID=2940496 RepID=UPI0023045939|nr:oligosaccharide flippase family protein [Acidovorax sp. GBBC 3334]MDA8454076.1 oligosaccharide flippase family protein [Acidovorax sp. GBBC 3334]